MKIAMFTNTFLPHVGGVAQSVASFAAAFRERGHHTLVVAPWMEGNHRDEPGVIRVPAWEHVARTGFSLPLPVPLVLYNQIRSFAPDLIHSHHPFLLGDTALRMAAAHDVPIIFTNHTRYDVYTHYLPWSSELIKRFASRLAAGYANLCDAVVAPSESIRDQLRGAGVESPIEVIPTGVDRLLFDWGHRAAFREKYGVTSDAFVVGHVGRLAREKNLSFLADTLAEFVAKNSRSWFIIAGSGPCEDEVLDAFRSRSCADRVLRLGTLSHTELADAYAAMDVFAFASLTETQGMVLVEAMASGTPVVAIDAPGVRELVRNGVNGYLLPMQDRSLFLDALTRLTGHSGEQRLAMRTNARLSAEPYRMQRCAARALRLYTELIDAPNRERGPLDAWHATVRTISQECRLLSNVLEAGAKAALRC